MREHAGTEVSHPRRQRIWGWFAVLFVAAQLVFAAHAGAAPDSLLDHSNAACAICLAGAPSDDPNRLAPAAPAPSGDFAKVEFSFGDAAFVEKRVFAASPRGPPRS